MNTLNCGGIPLFLHTIDILSCARDANIDTKCYSVHRFTISAYGMQTKLTWLYSSSSQFEATNGMCELPWSQLTKTRGYLLVKPSQEVAWASIALLYAFSARDLLLINSAGLLTKALR